MLSPIRCAWCTVWNVENVGLGTNMYTNTEVNEKKNFSPKSRHSMHQRHFKTCIITLSEWYSLHSQNWNGSRRSEEHIRPTTYPICENVEGKAFSFSLCRNGTLNLFAFIDENTNGIVHLCASQSQFFRGVKRIKRNKRRTWTPNIEHGTWCIHKLRFEL